EGTSLAACRVYHAPGDLSRPGPLVLCRTPRAWRWQRHGCVSPLPSAASAASSRRADPPPADRRGPAADVAVSVDTDTTAHGCLTPACALALTLRANTRTPVG